MAGIAERRVADTTIAIVDLETTGLYAGGDRIVELAIVRAEPNAAPSLILDTLVNPRRAVSATEIHGITDADVVGAPTFDDLAANVVGALRQAVFASYNVYFDARFMRAELAAAGVSAFPPYFCLMYLRPMLGLGARCSLGDACRAHGVDHQHTHVAAADAVAAARLWQFYVAKLQIAGVETFADLAALKSYKFTESFGDPVLETAPVLHVCAHDRLKPRSLPATRATDPRIPRHELLGEYWDALTVALSDFAVTPEELGLLKAKQVLLGITEDELRWMHARAFAGILALVCQDKAVTVDEVWALHNITNALRALGWAPGDIATELLGSAVAAS
jgi:DNA polymerase III epsilon subunit-like protein